MDKSLSPELECQNWLKYGKPEGATERHQLHFRVYNHYDVLKVFLRYFMVPFFNMFITITSYTLCPVEDLAYRYWVSAGLLIPTILFHINSVMKETAHTSKMSYFDMIMMIAYCSIAITVQFNVVLLAMHRYAKATVGPSGQVVSSPGYAAYAKAINDAVGAHVPLSLWLALDGQRPSHLTATCWLLPLPRRSSAPRYILAPLFEVRILGARRLPSSLGARRLPSSLGARRLPSSLGARRLPSTLGARRLPSNLGAAHAACRPV
ncbi:hypothetical protein CYMTET_43562, partial [Cymbomonas tetramitiformis]